MATLQEWKQKLDDLGVQVGQANDLVSQYQGASYLVPQLAKQRVSEMYNNNADLIGAETSAQAQLQTTPTDYAAQFSTGRFASNPILAGQASAQREATIQKNLQDIRGLKQERMGTQADIINAATGAFGAQTVAVQGVASNYQNQYQMANTGYNQAYQADQDRLAQEEQARKDAYQKEQDSITQARQASQDAEQKRQFEASNAVSWYNAKNNGSGSTTATEKAVKTDLSKYTFTEQKVGNNVKGYDFLDNNGLAVSPGAYFIAKQVSAPGGQLGQFDSKKLLTDMATLFTSNNNSNQGDKNIALEIITADKSGINPDDILMSIANKYNYLFNGTSLQK